MPLVLKDDFLEWLDEQKAARGIRTDFELTEKAGIAHSVISNARRGQRAIGWDALAAIAYALEISPVLVLTRAGLLSPDEYDRDEVVEEIVKRLERLTDNDRQEILAIVRTKQRLKGTI